MDLVWPVAAWALWVAALVAAFKLSDRGGDAEPAADPAVPAPVAEFLRGMRAQDVFHSTLLDLAGRGRLAIDGDLLSLTGAEEPAPAPYEEWALERVRARMAGARQAPVVALMPGGAALDADFVPLVRQAAIDLGLARRRWPTMAVPLLLAVTLVVPWYCTVAASGIAWPGIIATAVSLVAGIGLLMGGRGFLLTARGREVSAPGPVPADPQQEWIFTGSGWRSGEIDPAVPPATDRLEVTGHVVKRWADLAPGSAPRYYVALHDGASARATAYEVGPGVYRDVLPGDSVRLLVKPGRGAAVRVLAHDRHW
ncbi:hypothetical protein SAMN05421874_11892 [Nonomuraea maritima]|uniref:DUF2207 domain-containing protein n=1 Tax=Nonomuraea maritima TaxID=683260 RepID=A0A1G9ILN8_9ACTN|nr:hypothetical protein [Nonomuraea maritima]SDL25794.1 hypothetical protein SAMN05421874_11892 [Nonomuraea maritima]